MSQLRELTDADLKTLPREEIAALAQRMLQQLRDQDRLLDQRGRELEHKDHELKLKDAKIQKITFELARLKRWKFGAKTEAMGAEQRRLFEETCSEDEAALLAKLRELQGKAAAADSADTKDAKRKPRRDLRAPLLRPTSIPGDMLG